MARALAAVVIAATLAAAPIDGAIPQATRARDAYARAVQLEEAGNHGAALALLWEAASLDPRDADVQNRLGEALERMGALDAAVNAYRQALAARPDFRKASNNLILALVKSGRGEEATRRARALVTAAPDDPDRHFTLGLAQSEQDVEDAIRSFRRTLELSPRHALARYNLALVLRRGDRLAEALEELDRTIAIDPRPEAHYLVGVIHWHQGHVDKAVSALRAAISAEPAYADAHYTLGAVLKSKRDWTGAAASLRRAIALRPDLQAPRYTLAQVLELGGDAAGAQAQLAEADRLRRATELEQQARMLTVVGAQALAAGDAARALEHFQRATALLDTYAPAHYQAGLALRTLGRHEAARAAFARARQLNPSLVPPPPAVKQPQGHQRP